MISHEGNIMTLNVRNEMEPNKDKTKETSEVVVLGTLPEFLIYSF